MPARAARDDQNARRVFPAVPVIVNPRHFDFPALQAHSAPNGIHDGSRLFENFFQHEMLEPAFFQGFQLHFQRVNFRRDLVVLDGSDEQAACPVHTRNLLVFEVNHVLRVFDDGCGIRRDEVLRLCPNADDERAGFSCTNQLIRIILIHHNDGVGPLHTGERKAHAVEQIPFCGFLDFLDEVCEHFGIRITFENVPTLRQTLLQRVVILDDAVVDDCQFPVAS